MNLTFQNGLNDAPALNASAVTPADGTDLARPSRGLYVAATGDLKVTTYGGDTVTFEDIAAGVIHPIAARRVWSTGTTATGIIAVS
jgi:hypothetical protein